MRVLIIKSITWLAVLALPTAVCLIDSDSNVPFIVAGVSLTWLFLIIWANEDWRNV